MRGLCALATVYEIRDARPQFRAIGSVGRYDDLRVALGGEPLPGIGMAMGEVMAMLLRREGKLPALSWEVDVFVVGYSAAEGAAAIDLAQSLRAAGLRVDRSLQAASLSGQFWQAEAVGAHVAVTLAPEELAQGAAVVRDLRIGVQSTVAIGKVEQAVRAVAAG